MAKTWGKRKDGQSYVKTGSSSKMKMAGSTRSSGMKLNRTKSVTMKQFIESGNYLEDEIKRRAKKGSPHFFDADTMRFFSSRISEVMWQDGDVKNYQTNPIYFITSEADKGSVQHAGSARAFTVRKIDAGGDINKVGEFQGYSTLNKARKAIKDITVVGRFGAN